MAGGGGAEGAMPPLKLRPDGMVEMGHFIGICAQAYLHVLTETFKDPRTILFNMWQTI